MTIHPPQTTDVVIDADTGDGYSTSELWQTFQVELAQYAVNMRQQLVALSEPSQASDARTELLRVAHTLKGTAGMMGFPHVAQLTHRLEEALNEPSSRPLLSEIIRVLEELCGDKRDAIVLQTAPQAKSLASLTERLQQTVNHAAQVTGKGVQLVVEDAGVEINPALHTDLGEILLHLLRNAVVHGIEPAAQRTLLDKPETGTILVTAAYEHTRLVIQVLDDGRGIDPEAIRQAAITQGHFTPVEAARLSTEQLYDLLLQPGFSTAPNVTELVGRGMGLDVVNHRITQHRGTLLIESEPQRGTCVVICLPTRWQ